MLNFGILWRAIKTTIFLFGLVGLVAWFAATAPWYWRAGSALVVLAALAVTYQIFAALHVRRIECVDAIASGPRGCGARRHTHGGGRISARGAVRPGRALPETEDDELTPAQRRRLIAEIEARA